MCGEWHDGLSMQQLVLFFGHFIKKTTLEGFGCSGIYCICISWFALARFNTVGLMCVSCQGNNPSVGVSDLQYSTESFRGSLTARDVDTSAVRAANQTPWPTCCLLKRKVRPFPQISPALTRRQLRGVNRPQQSNTNRYIHVTPYNDTHPSAVRRETWVDHLQLLLYCTLN